MSPSGNTERQMLRDTVRSLVTKRADSAAVRTAFESERGYDENLWAVLCEQVGAAALLIPEESGGAGANSRMPLSWSRNSAAGWCPAH